MQHESKFSRYCLNPERGDRLWMPFHRKIRFRRRAGLSRFHTKIRYAKTIAVHPHARGGLPNVGGLAGTLHFGTFLAWSWRRTFPHLLHVSLSFLKPVPGIQMWPFSEYA